MAKATKNTSKEEIKITKNADVVAKALEAHEKRKINMKLQLDDPEYQDLQVLQGVRRVHTQHKIQMHTLADSIAHSWKRKAAEADYLASNPQIVEKIRAAKDLLNPRPAKIIPANTTEAPQ